MVTLKKIDEPTLEPRSKKLRRHKRQTSYRAQAPLRSGIRAEQPHRGAEQPRLTKAERLALIRMGPVIGAKKARESVLANRTVTRVANSFHSESVEEYRKSMEGDFAEV